MRNNQKQNLQKSSNLNESEKGLTDEIMAKKAGVSKNTYRDMKTVVQKGTPEQIARMDKGIDKTPTPCIWFSFI